MSRPVRFTLAAIGFSIGATIAFLQPLPSLAPHAHTHTRARAISTRAYPVDPPGADAAAAARQVQTRYLPTD